MGNLGKGFNLLAWDLRQDPSLRQNEEDDPRRLAICIRALEDETRELTPGCRRAIAAFLREIGPEKHQRKKPKSTRKYADEIIELIVERGLSHRQAAEEMQSRRIGGKRVTCSAAHVGNVMREYREWRVIQDELDAEHSEWVAQKMREIQEGEQ